MISILSLEEKTTKHSLLPSLYHPTTWGCFYKAVICKPRTKPSWETRLASILIGCSPVVLVVKNQPANAGDIRNTGLILGGEDPLAEGIATHSSILARKIPWSEDPDGLQSVRSHRVRHEWSDLAQNLNSHLNLQNFSSAPYAEISLALSPLHSFLRFYSFKFGFKFYIRVNLQCHVSSRCTTKWFSYTYTCIYSFSNYFPIQAATEFWVEFPVLHCMSLFYFTLYVVVCMCQSQTPSLSLPTSPFPTWCI